MESAQNLTDSKPDISCQYLKIDTVTDIVYVKGVQMAVDK
jgi:hypothetical protein